MIPGEVAKVLPKSDLSLIGNTSSLASLAEDFVPTIRNSETTCIPCGGAIRAETPSDRTVTRGMAGGYVGHCVGGQIWGMSNDTWKSENDGENLVTHEMTGNPDIGHYTGEQRYCTAHRIRSVYGAEYAGGYVGFMEAGSTADVGSLSVLGGLLSVDNLLGTLNATYATIKRAKVTGPLRGLDEATWNAWKQYVGANGQFLSDLLVFRSRRILLPFEHCNRHHRVPKGKGREMKSKWKKVSVICGVIGLCCIIAAGLFAFYNMYDDTRAANDLKSETEMLEAIVLSHGKTNGKTHSIQTEEVEWQEPTSEPILIVPAETETPAEPTPEPDEPSPEPTEEPTPEPTPEPPPVPDSMPVVIMDGAEYVAIISIPALDLEFCVRSEWDKEGAKKSPCRYVGSVYTNDLMICAHNYSSHFGRLKELQYGDQIILVDMNGEVYTYHVEFREELGRFDVEEMISSGYDLTLFTCTIGGKARVTVRCTRDSRMQSGSLRSEPKR